MLQFIKKIFSPFANFSFTLGKKLKELFVKKIDEKTFEEFEKLLYEADLGVAITSDLTSQIRHVLQKNPNVSFEEVIEIIRKYLSLICLESPAIKFSPKPLVMMVVGANGSGKTTSLAKLAKTYKEMGKKVLIIAADTFRSAATEQIELWAKKVDVDIVKGMQNADPAAVVFDGLAAAKKREVDIVLIDTAGRLHNKENLLKELKKIVSICQKQIPDAPHITLLTLDASIGQNALDQAKTFDSFVPLNGFILTKLDGSAKGGIVILLQKELKIPIYFVGTGEKDTDLSPFDKKEFLDSLLKT